MPSASSIELGEQSFTFIDSRTCGPDGSCETAATPLADSVPSGPAWPTAKMAAPACSWPGLAWGMTTSVPPEVVTGIRAPLNVTRVKPAVLASATVPWTGTKPAGFTALNGCPTVMMAAGARGGQAALHRPDRDLQHSRDLGEAEPGAEGKAQYLPVGWCELSDRIPHLGQFGPVQGHDLRSRTRTRLIGQEGVIHHPQSLTSQPVPGLPPGDGDHPGPHRRLTPEGARPAPDSEHRVLHDLLSQYPVADYQQNLRKHHSAVLTVERGHRILVALPDPAQQTSIVAGRIVTGGEG